MGQILPKMLCSEGAFYFEPGLVYCRLPLLAPSWTTCPRRANTFVVTYALSVGLSSSTPGSSFFESLNFGEGNRFF